MKQKGIQTSFRLSYSAFKVLDEVQEREGFSSRTAALEVILRDYARANGIKINFSEKD